MILASIIFLAFGIGLGTLLKTPVQQTQKRGKLIPIRVKASR